MLVIKRRHLLPTGAQPDSHQRGFWQPHETPELRPRPGARQLHIDPNVIFGSEDTIEWVAQEWYIAPCVRWATEPSLFSLTTARSKSIAELGHRGGRSDKFRKTLENFLCETHHFPLPAHGSLRGNRGKIPFGLHHS